MSVYIILFVIVFVIIAIGSILGSYYKKSKSKKENNQNNNFIEEIIQHNNENRNNSNYVLFFLKDEVENKNNFFNILSKSTLEFLDYFETATLIKNDFNSNPNDKVFVFLRGDSSIIKIYNWLSQYNIHPIIKTRHEFREYQVTLRQFWEYDFKNCFLCFNKKEINANEYFYSTLSDISETWLERKMSVSEIKDAYNNLKDLYIFAYGYYSTIIEIVNDIIKFGFDCYIYDKSHLDELYENTNDFHQETNNDYYYDSNLKQHYEILGISQCATIDEIKSAYKKLAKKYHPDICKLDNAEELFKKINESYSIIIEYKKTVISE